MAAIVTTTEVDRPADDVFACATDPTRRGSPRCHAIVVGAHSESPTASSGTVKGHPDSLDPTGLIPRRVT
jgi:hypothetical protein